MSEIDDYWQTRIEPLEEELKQARWFAKNIVAAMAPVLLDSGLGVDAKPSEVIAQVEKLRMDHGRLQSLYADASHAVRAMQAMHARLGTGDDEDEEAAFLAVFHEAVIDVLALELPEAT